MGGGQGRVLPSCSTSALRRSCVPRSWKSGFLGDLIFVPAAQRPLLVWIQGGSLPFLRMQRTFFFSSPHVTVGLHLSPQSTGCFTHSHMSSLVFLRRVGVHGLDHGSHTPSPRPGPSKEACSGLQPVRRSLSPSGAVKKGLWVHVNSPWVKRNHGLFMPGLANN